MSCVLATPVIEYKPFLLRDTRLPRMTHSTLIKTEPLSNDEEEFSTDSWETVSDEELEEVMEVAQNLLSPAGSPVSRSNSEDMESLHDADENIERSAERQQYTTDDSFSKGRKVIVEECEELQSVKRERNRLAARRCRQKQKDRIDVLEKDVLEIETENYKVQNEIQILQQQLKELRHMLLNHDCVMKAPQLTHSGYYMNF